MTDFKPLSGPTPMTDAAERHGPGGAVVPSRLSRNLERIAAEAVRALEFIAANELGKVWSVSVIHPATEIENPGMALVRHARAALSRIKAAGREDSARLDGKEGA